MQIYDIYPPQTLHHFNMDPDNIFACDKLAWIRFVSQTEDMVLD